MFIFYGSFNNKLIRTMRKNIILLFQTVLIPMALIGIIGGSIYSNKTDDYSFLVLSILLVFADILIIIKISLSSVYQMPRKIIFDIENNVFTNNIVGLDERYVTKMEISKIERIIDYDYWYLVCFQTGGKFQVQKDLITQGSLVDFEEHFKDIIVPAKKHK